MKLAKRFAFYLGGFLIGLILLFYFVGGSGASCDYAYGPNARVLKNIRLKEKSFSPEVLRLLADHQLDTSAVTTLLNNGNVLFSESDTNLDSCKIYKIESNQSKYIVKVTVENCTKIAKFFDLEIK